MSSNFENMSTPSNGHGLVSIAMDESIKEYFFISLESLKSFKNQARKIFDDEDLEKLAESIKNYWLRQHLTVIRCK